MDPLTVSVIVVLSKYVLDKGVELGKAVGPDAIKAAQEMFRMVVTRVGGKKPEMTADYAQDPETNQKPMEKALDAEVTADKDLAAQLKALVEQYEQAAQAYAKSTGQTYTDTAGDHSTIAQGGSAVNTGSGVAVAGNAGDIRVSQPDPKP